MKSEEKKNHKTTLHKTPLPLSFFGHGLHMKLPAAFRKIEV